MKTKPKYKRSGHATVGDRVRYHGRLGTVVRDRLNGMVDIECDPYKVVTDPDIPFPPSGGLHQCVYRDEFKTVRKHI